MIIPFPAADFQSFQQFSRKTCPFLHPRPAPLAPPLGEPRALPRRAGMPPRAMPYALHPTNGCPAPLDPGLRTRPLALPLGELSPKVTERVSRAGYPLRRLIAASPPKGGAKGGCRRQSRTGRAHWCIDNCRPFRLALSAATRRPSQAADRRQLPQRGSQGRCRAGAQGAPETAQNKALSCSRPLKKMHFWQ